MAKRVFDIICTTTGILVLSPVLLLVAIAVKLGSKGPVFYRGQRAGRYGKPFRILKFRSMVTDAEQLGGSSTSDDDPRITGVGKLMRKLKLDELPQLLNVLTGEMGLVGPRPQVFDYVSAYSYSDEEQAILQVRPGITDWASIWNSDEGAVLAGAPDPDKAYDELIHPTKMKLQLFYVRQHNLWVDLKILTYTLYGLVYRGWIPPEIRSYPKPPYPKPLEANASGSFSYETVTELPGAAVHSEQIKMLKARYGWAGELAEGKEVLEVACGSGIGLGHLAARAKRVVGGDYDPKLAEIAKQQYDDRIEVQVMNAQSLPFSDASFDVVLLFEALYYLERPELFVQEAHRVLRPSGLLLICSANRERPDFNVSPFSTRYFSARELQELLVRNGFSATIRAGFPLAPQGWKNQVWQVCRRVAVKLRLIPKTMKWKARFKRVFFGKLQTLPAALEHQLSEREPMAQIDVTEPVSNYKVIYAIGTREAMASRAAA